MAVLKDESEEEQLAGGDASPTPQAVQGNSSQGVGAGSSAQNPGYTQSNFTSGKMILNANKDAAQPDLTQGFAQKANDASSGLQKSQDDYQKNLSDKQASYGYSDQDLDSAAGGDANSFTKIKGMLSGNDQLAGYSYDPKLDIQDVNKLNSSAGAQDELQQQAQKNGNFNYTQGQAALDATLFGRSANGAQKQIQTSLAQKKAVEDASDKAKGEQTLAQQNAQQNINSNVSGLYTKLGGMLNGVQDQALNNKVNYIREHGNAEQDSANKAIYDQAVQSAKQQAEQDANGDPEYTKALQEQYLQQIDQNKNNLADLGYQDTTKYLYNDDLANRFNKINELLGNKLSAQSPNSLQGPTATLGKGYQDALKQGKSAADQYLLNQQKSQEESTRAAQERATARAERTRNQQYNNFGVPTSVAEKISAANDSYAKSQVAKADAAQQAANALRPSAEKAAEDAGQKISEVAKATGRNVADEGKKAIKKLCFGGGTPVKMVDGKIKDIERIKLGDVCELGGKVNVIKQAYVPSDEVYDYMGIEVTGSHAVLEGGNFIRVKDSEKASWADSRSSYKVVYSITNENHRLLIDGITFADDVETSDDIEDLDLSLAELNKKDNQCFQS